MLSLAAWTSLLSVPVWAEPAPAPEGGEKSTPVFFVPFRVDRPFANQERLLREMLSARMMATGRFVETITPETEKVVQQCVNAINRAVNAETCWIRLGQGQGAEMMVAGEVMGSAKSCSVAIRLTVLETRISSRKHVRLLKPCAPEDLVAEMEVAAAVLAGEKAPQDSSRRPPRDEQATPVVPLAPERGATGPRIEGGSVTEAVGNLVVEVKPFGQVRLEFRDPNGRTFATGSPYKNAKAVVGTWELRATGEGYDEEIRQIIVPPDETTLVKVELHKLGGLEITGSPAGSAVEVTGPDDFRDARGLPWKAQGLKAGTYRVKVAREGYQTYEAEVEVASGRTSRVEARLEKERVQPAPAVVSDDDVPEAITSLANGGSSEWDGKVKAILLNKFDTNRSGALDNASELGQLTCPIWEALDRGVKQKYQSGLLGTYGFRPGYAWVGGSLGIAEALRSSALAAGERCLAEAAGGSSTSGGAGVVAAIDATPDGGSSKWDEAVKQIVVQAFDTDRDGLLDTTAEVDRVTCEVWQALDRGVKQKYQSGLLNTYGFKPNLSWLGKSVGFADAMRSHALAAGSRCLDGGSGTSQAPPSRSGSTSSVVSAIEATPDGGSSAWDGQVKTIITGAFDSNRSGLLEQTAEVDRVDCAVWGALDRGVKQKYQSGLLNTYGFNPNLSYLGGSLGFAESMREYARKAGDACLRDGGGGGSSSSAPVAPGQVVTAIKATPDGGSSAWDGRVKTILVGAFDSDRSGKLDRTAEVDSLGCAVWQALNQGVKQKYQSGLLGTYGFQPNLSWLGGSLGFGDSMRQHALKVGTACIEGGGGASRGHDGSALGMIEASAHAVSSGDWDTDVKSALLRHYDTDRSGTIDTATEVGRIPCEVWRGMDRALKGAGRTGMLVTYGFEEGFSYVGYAFGIKDTMRRQAYDKMKQCGVPK